MSFKPLRWIPVLNWLKCTHVTCKVYQALDFYLKNIIFRTVTMSVS